MSRGNDSYTGAGDFFGEPVAPEVVGNYDGQNASEEGQATYERKGVGEKPGEEPGKSRGISPPIPLDAAEIHVIGPPGTGKTTTLARDIIPEAVRLYGRDRVLVASLTVAAAQEIASRGSGIPSSQVGTLHSFARSALSGPFGTVTSIQTAKYMRLWNESDAGQVWPIKGTGRRATEDAPTEDETAAEGTDTERDISGDEGGRLLGQLDKLRARMVPREDWPLDVCRFQDAWDEFSASHSDDKEIRMDFAAMIERARTEDTHPPFPRWDGSGICDGVLIIDEAQDFCAQDMALVRHWGDFVRVVVLAGDPNQAIYGFRGADPKQFHDPVRDADIPTHVLKQSYRLPRRVQQVAEDLLARSLSRVANEYLPREGDPGSASETQVSLSGHQFPVLLQQALDGLVHEEGDHRRVMVLGGTRFTLRDALKQLRSACVPFGNPYTSEPAWNPLGAVRARIRPLMRELRPDLFPKTDADGRPDDTWGLWSWRDVHKWTGHMKLTGLLRKGQGKRIVEEMSAKNPTARMDRMDIERVFQDPQWILSEVVPHLRGEVEGVSGYAYALQLFEERGTAKGRLRLAQTEYAVGVGSQHGQSALLVDEPRVIVGTVHSVKGGTAGHVFVSPDLSGPARREIEATSPSNPDVLDPLVRLFYVAVTRASRGVTLLRPGPQARRYADGAFAWPPC